MKSLHPNSTIPLLFLAAAFLCILAYRFGVLGYDVHALQPDEGYEIQIEFVFNNGPEPGSFAAYLPQSDERQYISSVEYAGPTMKFSEREESGLQGIWHSGSSSASTKITYRFYAKIQEIAYDISLDAHIQEMAQAVYEGSYPSTSIIKPASITSRSYQPPKNEVFLEAAESFNIQGRLVNGIILDNIDVPIPHTWIELLIDEAWIPFDVQKGHFASLPGTYLSIWKGPETMLSHPAGATITHAFSVVKERISKQSIQQAQQALPEDLNPFSIWLAFLDTGMPLVSLKILLLIPVAATIVAFFRNVIGFETYGVFLPALIAVSGLHTGLIPTVGGFLLITLLVAVVHGPLERSGLLYVPKLALLLLTVVVLLMSLSYLGLVMGWSEIFSLSLLPLVILAISAEKLSQHLKEEGLLKALQVMGTTLLVIATCYLVINAHLVQWLIFSFPETMILICAANLWMGHWIGMRLTEYRRFKWLTGKRRRFHPVQTSILGINRRNRVVIHQTNHKRDVALADDKVLSKSILSDHHIPVPQTHMTFSEVREIKERWHHLVALDEFVVKPANGKKGQNILVLERQKEGWVTPGGRFITASNLKKSIAEIVMGGNSKKGRDTAIVEYRVEPHPFFTAIYNQGLPDIRVITHHDEIVQAMLRIPTKDSDGKANLHQGALGIGIDIDTGRLKHGLYKDAYIAEHPDSQTYFEGEIIPYWEKILKMCRQTAEILPLKYLGIDVVIDSQEGPLILEINARPGLQIQNINAQGLRPLLHSPSPVAVNQTYTD